MVFFAVACGLGTSTRSVVSSRLCDVLESRLTGGTTSCGAIVNNLSVMLVFFGRVLKRRSRLQLQFWENGQLPRFATGDGYAIVAYVDSY